MMIQIKTFLTALFLSFMIFVWISVVSLFGMDRPNPNRYPNPYKLITEKKIRPQVGTSWQVICNRANAPILDATEEGSGSAKANYLELFDVLKRNGKYLYVRSNTREHIEGWMKMHHLILTHRAIMDPETSVFHKVFLKVRLEEEVQTEDGLNSLRLRDGPGEGVESTSNRIQNQYIFLTDKDEIAHVGSLFFYVYGVHFNDSAERYQDVANYKDANYFLIGNSPSFNIGTDITENERVILGWIPRSTAVLWDTRQALEKMDNRPKKDWEAHKFLTRKLLNQYFSMKDEIAKEQFLKDNSDEIVQDFGEGSPKSGQMLRDIVLQVGHGQKNFNGVLSEYIGYTGHSTDIGDGQQDFLAQLHEGAKTIEIFFLIDATLSMEPCLEATALVTEKVLTQIQGEGIKKIAVYGAIYRDESEGIKKYEEWDPNSKIRIYQWFKKAKAYSLGMDDYPENLFNAMNQAIEGWKNRFSNTLSLRVMVILGDAGDHGRFASPGIESVIQNLKDNMILPLAIHFQHPHRRSSDAEIEKRAFKAYINQFNHINQSIYDVPELQNIQSIPKEALTGDLEKYVSSAANTIIEFIKNMPKVRRGQKSLCEMAFRLKQEQVSDCKSSCTDENSFMQYLEAHLPSKVSTRTGEANIGIALAYLKALKNKNPALWKYVMERPEESFSEGFVALKKQGRYITRPVLLLGGYELERIRQSIHDIRTRYRDCDNAKNHDLLVEAMSTILGELLQTDTNKVSIEKLNSWLDKSIIAPEKNFLGAKEIVSHICQNNSLWSGFLKQLEHTEKKIINLEKKRPKSKHYLNIQTTSYFWINPEDIFPSPKTKGTNQ